MITHSLAQVDAIIDASRTQKRALQRRLRTVHKQMYVMLEAEGPQETELLEQIDRIGSLRTAPQ